MHVTVVTFPNNVKIQGGHKGIPQFKETVVEYRPLKDKLSAGIWR